MPAEQLPSPNVNCIHAFTADAPDPVFCEILGHAHSVAHCKLCSANAKSRVPREGIDPSIIVIVPLRVNGGEIRREKPALKALPHEKWPAWAKMVARKATAEDRGVGDTVKRLIGDKPSAIFKATMRAVFGLDCGCDARQELWDIIYRY